MILLDWFLKWTAPVDMSLADTNDELKWLSRAEFGLAVSATARFGKIARLRPVCAIIVSFTLGLSWRGVWGDALALKSRRSEDLGFC